MTDATLHICRVCKLYVEFHCEEELKICVARAPRWRERSPRSTRMWSQAQLLHDMLHEHPRWPFGTSERTRLDDVDVWDEPDPDDTCVGPDDPGVGPWTHEFDD